MREDKKQCTSQHEASPSSVRCRGLPQQCLPAVRVFVKASSLRKHTQPVYRSVVIRGQNRRTQVDVPAAAATRESRTSGDANKQVLCASNSPVHSRSMRCTRQLRHFTGNNRQIRHMPEQANQTTRVLC